MFGHGKGNEIDLQTGSRAIFYWVEIYSQKFTSILRQGWRGNGVTLHRICRPKGMPSSAKDLGRQLSLLLEVICTVCAPLEGPSSRGNVRAPKRH
jgi:hypothetical protein